MRTAVEISTSTNKEARAITNSPLLVYHISSEITTMKRVYGHVEAGISLGFRRKERAQ